MIDGLLPEARAPVSTPAARTILVPPHAEPTPRTPLSHDEIPAGETRYDRIERVLRDAGRPLSIREVRARLNEMGDGSPDPVKFYNVIDSAMRSGEQKRRYRRVGKGLWALPELLYDEDEDEGDDSTDTAESEFAH